MKSIRLMLAGASLLLFCSCGAQVQKETQVANANESKENAVIETIMSRRSIRQYKPQAVNRDTMQIILDCGINAPNGQNKQSWAVRVVDNPEFINGITEVYKKVNPKVAEDPGFKNMFRNAPTVVFIANDTYLDDKKQRISIITGPNMAGKSTYMRQAALIVLMAQLGSFVPASSANIGLVDRIFTRVGASDDLASGQSTFMVEMNEVANILRNATSKSLLILDEIGRGTSTFDGLSIAWAVVEYISNSKLLGAKTLFATHYHELTELEGKLPGVNNYCIAVQEKGDTIIFLRKIIKGSADKSYGIQVAKLAGVPDVVLNRAKELVVELSDADISQKAKDIAQYSKKVEKMNDRYKKVNELEVKQMTLFDTVKDDDIIKDIKELDISNMTPIDALNILYKLQGKVKNRYFVNEN